MGDNRANSLDSRYPTVGVIKRAKLKVEQNLEYGHLIKLVM